MVWMFEDIESVKDIKGVYYGAKKKGTIDLNDIQQYEITVEHSSGRSAQFLFYEQQEAFSFFTTLKSLHERCNARSLQSPRPPLRQPVSSGNMICDGQYPQIGL